ncbi:MAG: serine hydrolase domain-containing protein [Pusillimonas sp.]
MKRMLAALLLGAGVGMGAHAHGLLPAKTEAMPGCAWALLHSATTPATGAWGDADTETGRAIDAGTVFNIASVSKQFTALAILLLVQDKQLDLDRPLSQYLPQITGELGKPTLRQMLRHTGGLPDYIDPLFEAGREDEVVTAAETLEVIARQPRLRFAPGARFEYSNTGYFLLAQVVEHVSGQALATFSRQYIFEPLGMRDTTIVDHYPSGITAMARGYQIDAGRARISESRWEQTGDGQVHASARDMLRWLRHLDDDTVLSTPSGRPADAGVLSLLTSGDTPVSEARNGYQFGLEAIKLEHENAWAHGGGWAGYRSFMAYAPESRRGVAVLCNTTDVSARGAAGEILAGAWEAPASARRRRSLDKP